MTSNGFEKFYGYPKNTSWIKVFLFAYVYGGLFVFAAVVLTKLADPETSGAVIAALSGRGVNDAFVYAALSLVLWLTFVVCGIFLPLIDKKAYWTTMVHLAALALYRPVLVLATWLAAGSGGLPRTFLLRSAVLFAVELVFAAVNAAYFSRRKELFTSSLTELVMDESDPKPRF
jgi:hypothetical protein